MPLDQHAASASDDNSYLCSSTSSTTIMANSYSLTNLDPYAFENLVNLLAMKTLGNGVSGFAAGSDGGRDGYFEGEAPYPSETDRWKGVWYIQSKFHAPHLSKDPQKWLIEQVRKELSAFIDPSKERAWPDNWIIATNIDPSGTPNTGSFDVINEMVAKSTEKKINVAIWGGAKILDLLTNNPEAAEHYAHFITPGQILTAIKNQLSDQYASISTIINFLVSTQFSEQIYTKLDQAGSSVDTRPGVHHLFIDLPFSLDGSDLDGFALDHLCRASARPQRHSVISSYPKVLRDWSSNPQHSRVALLKGGPGQGKSTVGQYFSQIQRASLLLLSDAPPVTDKVKAFAIEVQMAATAIGAWPSAPRIPVFIELKEYAHWFGQQSINQPRGVLTYLASKIGARVEQEVLPATLRRALPLQSWFVLFDGLDEVPNDVKDKIADEVNHFVNEIVIQTDADVLTLCTSRPQGYSGQFAALDCPVLNLQKLDVEIAIRCAEPVVRYDRSQEEGTRSLDLLKAAAASQSVQQLMTTPLQSHIMAVVVRDGGRPPERRWQLFENFYQVMKKRESLKNVHNPRISRLLREEDRLLRAVHTRLGFVLHARAEQSDGAQTTLTREEFKALVAQVVDKLSEHDTQNTVDVVMEAMTERLVLVSTPENGAHVRFDIRQLQEFFAAEFLYDTVPPEILATRIEIVGGDSHWLEVIHFLLSALVENRRTTELDVAIKVLERLNEGNLDGSHRLFYRRMAKGAILATRLLVEGVLEQDKRDRLRFRTLFDPIGGLLDANILASLRNVQSPNSKIWLINLLRDKISEANYPESIGAVSALGWILPNENSLGRELVQWFKSCPSTQQQQALSAWNTFDLGNFRARYAEKLSPWTLAAVIGVANSHQWSLVSDQARKDICSILMGQGKFLPEAFELAGIESNLQNFISALFNGEMAESPSDSIKVRFGPLAGSQYRHTWATASLSEDLAIALAGLQGTVLFGFFELTKALLDLAVFRSFDAMQAVFSFIPKEKETLLDAVPPWLTALLPFAGEQHLVAFDCSHFRAMSGTDFERFVSLKEDCASHFPMDSLFIDRKNRGDDEGWKSLFSHFPSIAVNIVLADSSVGFGVDSDTQAKYQPAALQTLLNSPRIAKSHFLSWGIFYGHNQKDLEAIKEAVKIEGCRGSDIVYGKRDIAPFPIELSDGYSLCLLTKGLFQSIDYLPANEWNEVFQELSRVISTFGLNAEELDRVSSDTDKDLSTRAAAHLLSLICNDTVPTDHRLRVALEDISKIRSLVDDETAAWYVEGLCRLMQKETGAHVPSALAATDALLVIAKSRPEIREPLCELLGVWREASLSPVHSRQVLQVWLEE